MKNKLLFAMILASAINCLGDDSGQSNFSDGTSWKSFELYFRKKYSHLDIPPIQATDEADARYSSTQKLIQFNPAQSPSLLNAEYTLLHETGHHNYPDQQRRQNHDQVDKYLNKWGQRVRIALTASTGLLTAANGYKLFTKKVAPRLLLTQIAIMGALSQLNNLDAALYPMLAIRPEEYAADAFANQHATKDVLLAEQKKLSQEFSQEQFIKILDYLEQEPTCFGLSCRKQVVKAAIRTLPVWHRFWGCTDLEHPLDSRRHQIISEALKDRFGNEQNN